MRHPDLTEKQKLVLLLIGDGLTDSQIGEEMGITGHTAGWHVANLKALYNVRRKNELVLCARKYFRY